MQAFLHLPSWIPGSIHDRAAADKMACTKPHPTPVVDIPLLNKLKRHRSNSYVSTVIPDGTVAKKQRLFDNQQLPPAPQTVQATAKRTSAGNPATADASNVNNTCLTISTSTLNPTRTAPAKKVVMPAVVTNPERRAELQQKIECQLNLEILLKHNELRLIEQELAKCQIALEQLRRCEAIPYPGEPGSTILPEQISTGVGPALEPPAGFTIPTKPAPWGVVDGPYSRHYAQWLIPDPQFDSVSAQSLRFSTTSRSFSGIDSRATRGGLSDRRTAGKSRSNTAGTPHLQALSTNYATPKDKQGPLIIKRPSDGQLVKLVCNECQRDNFSSVQGFLNHCRIAHGRNLDSHGAAAIACGVPVDASETSVLETSAPPEPTVSTPHSGRPLVHPFITSTRTDKVSGSTTPTTPRSETVSSEASPRHKSSSLTRASKPDAFTFPKEFAGGQFVPSSQTPRLSALVQKYGLGADFNKMVDQAKQKIDLDLIEELNQDDEDGEDTGNAMDVDQILPAAPKAVANPKTALSGVRMPTSRGRPTPLRTDLGQSVASTAISNIITVPGTPVETDRTDFSPHTMESNPGMISDRDDEDYEDHTSRSSEEDEWSEHGAEHSVQVRQPHHRDDEHLNHILEETAGLDSGTTCAPISSPISSPPVKRKRGRPSKRGRKR